MQGANKANGTIDNLPSRYEQALLFARNFLKHPKMLGSVIPSSSFLIGALLKQIDFDKARVIVEYGPGVGTISVELLRRMRPDAHLVLIETNKDFVRFLKETINDPRLHVVLDSAAQVDRILADLGLDSADYVISGIPFSQLPEQVRQDVVLKTRDVLSPEGAFLVYQFTNRVERYLVQRFTHIDRDFELLNVLPARLFFCRNLAA
jgi:phospholipid N-methyltransferase